MHTAVSTVAQRSKVLGTAYVVLEANNGSFLTVRALLDPGAEESFLSERVVQTLNLKKQPDNVVISGVGFTITAVAKSRVSLFLKSKQDSTFCLDFSALVLKKLTSTSRRRAVEKWPPFADLTFTDPRWGQPAKVNCILVAEVCACFFQEGMVQGPPTERITALNSVFGWVILGSLRLEQGRESHLPTTMYLAVQEDLLFALTRFWEIEKVPSTTPFTPAEEECYQHFKDTHCRNAEGRFVV